MSHYVPLCTTMYHYVILCTTMCHYAPLCNIMYHYVPLWTIMYHYVPLCNIMYDYIPLCTTIYHYVPLCTIMYHYVTLRSISLCVPKLWPWHWPILHPNMSLFQTHKLRCLTQYSCALPNTISVQYMILSHHNRTSHRHVPHHTICVHRTRVTIFNSIEAGPSGRPV